MKWLGKFIGGAFGFAVAGPLGLVLGVFFGHSVDKTLSDGSQMRSNWRNFQQDGLTPLYFSALFTVMGHIAKADGRVSEAEIHYAREVMANMALSAPAVRQAIDYFNAGKKSAFKVGEVITRLQGKTPPNHVLIQTLLENLIGIAYIDGPMTSQQRMILLQVCDALGVSHIDFARLDALMRAQYDFYRASEQQRRGHSSQQRSNYSRQTQSDAISLNEAYEILEITPNASDQEAKKAYRRLMSRHHPDKLMAQGLSEDMIKLATSKAQRVKAAYDAIKKARGI